MYKRLIAVLLIGLAVFIWGCPKDDDEDTTPTPTPTPDDASGTARSTDTTTTTVQTPAGVVLTIPPGAVPPFDDGSPCTQTFSIERTNSSPAGVPAGETLASDIYRFGPEGFTFASPVQVTIPMLNVPEGHDVLLYRTNQATGEAEQMPAIYDPGTGKISANTYDFCCWFGTTRPARDDASGCIMVTNISNHWVRICVDSYTLTYPDQNEWMSSYGEGGLWAPPGTIGWANSSKYYIPQGQHHLCIQWAIQPFWDSPITYVHRFTDVTVGSAWNYWTNPNCSATLSISDPVGADTGACNCIPHPTSPAHTGEVQVTMTWYVNDADGVDIDLHVIEPSGEEIYFGHMTSATGGQLDMDNTCGDFRSGVSENIFWNTNPPGGEYIVKVHYWGDCGEDDHPTQAFGIRTVVRGQTRTFTNSVVPSEMKEITRFTVSGGAVQFLPPQPESVFVTLPKSK